MHDERGFGEAFQMKDPLPINKWIFVMLNFNNSQVKSPFGPGYPCHSVGGKQYFSHRLVAFTFIPMIEGKNVVNHMNGDTNNSCVSNLEWTDLSGNRRHALESGITKIPTTKVKQFDKDWNFIKEYSSIKKVKAELGKINIHRSINTGSAAGGYRWKLSGERRSNMDQ